MRRRILPYSVLIFLGICSAVFAQEGPAAVSPSEAGKTAMFKKYNADVDKYAFTKAFILSVSYYKRVSDRLRAGREAKASAGSDLKLIRKFIEDCILNNTELRIARNYLTRFKSSENGLVQKVSRQAISAYEGVLALSTRERGLWQDLYQFKSTGQPADFNEQKFGRKQIDIQAEKKEQDKALLAASLLIRTVLLSAERCDGEDCKILVLTRKERDKLVGYLDEFAGDNLEWGIKAGQSPVEGCVAAVREVLEDPLFISADQ